MKRKKMQQIEMFAAPQPEPAKATPVVRDLTPQAERLLANFEVLAEAEGGVERLRELVLGLAIGGRLVLQDPNDEPAEKLLNRIKEGRATVANERRLRQSDEVEYSSPTDGNAPPGWIGVHVNDVAIVQGGKRLPNGAVFSEVPTAHVYIRVTDMKNGTISETGLKYISPTVHREIARYIINKEDLYITIAGTIGEVGIVPESLDGQNLTENAAKIVFRGFDKRFFLLALTSELMQAQFLDKTKQMAQPKLALKRIAGAKFYLPPLAEQKRIVAKVDELMKLCDELEARQAKQRDTGTRMTKAALDALANAEGPEELAAAWERVVGNFEGLISRAEDVKKVRETVLSLAVRGRLVKQVKGDGDTATIVADIAKKRTRLVASGIASRFDTASPIPIEEYPYSVPASWRWVRFAEITICRDGQRIPVSKEERQGRVGPYDYYGASGVIDKIDNYIYDEPLLLIGEDGANLINRSTPIAFIATGKYWVNNHAHVLDGLDLDSLRYLEVFINAIDLKPYVTGTAQPKMNQAKMNSIPVALPPLPEQKRIVAKVDQLMALCDELETKLRQSEETSRKVAEALVAELVQGTGDS